MFSVKSGRAVAELEARFFSRPDISVEKARGEV